MVKNAFRARKTGKIDDRITGGTGHEDQNKKVKVILAVCVFCFAFFLFLNSIGNDFVHDDRIVVERNELIQEPSRFLQIFSTPYHYDYEGAHAALYRPVTILSFALDYSVSGFSKYIFHLSNIVLHALVSLLVYFLMLEIDRRLSLAFAVSLFFASHPIHTEVVANIAGRAELLYALFFVAAFIFYVQCRRSKGSRMVFFLALSLISFLISLLSKESAIVFPAVIIAYDLIMHRESTARVSHRRRTIALYIVFVGVAASYLLIRFFILGSLTGGGSEFPIENPLSTVGFHDRFLGATKVLGKYLWMLVFPLWLSPDYSFNQIQIPQSPFELSVILTAVILLIVAFIFIKSLKNYPIVSFALAFFCITYSIISNYFLTIGVMMKEQLMYLPSLAFCIILGAAIHSFGTVASPEKRVARSDSGLKWIGFMRYQIVILCIITVFYSVRTIVRNTDWRDEHAIFASAEKVSSNSIIVLNNAGAALHATGRYDDAVERFKKALSIYPDYSEARNNLAQSYLKMGEMDKAEEEILRLLDKHTDFESGYFTYAEILKERGKQEEAIKNVRKALDIRPDFSEAQDLLGRILLETGDYEQAERALREAVQSYPSSVVFHNDLGLLYMLLNRSNEAIESFRKAYELDPDNAATMNNLGTAYRTMNRLEEALDCFEKALGISPHNVAILYNSGLTLLDLKKYEQAAEKFREITDKDPDNYEALTKLGSVMISLDKVDEALGYLTRAVKSNPDNEEAYDLRAKIYFFQGRYEESLSDYSRIVAIDPTSIAARNNMGTIYAIQEKYDLARTQWEEALRLAPEQKEIRSNLEKLKTMGK